MEMEMYMCSGSVTRDTDLLTVADDVMIFNTEVKCRLVNFSLQYFGLTKTTEM